MRFEIKLLDMEADMDTVPIQITVEHLLEVALMLAVVLMQAHRAE